MALLKARFLDEFRQSGNITATVRAVGIGRTTLYKWRAADKEFAAALADAAEEAVEGAEWEARRRAMGVVEVPVFHKGEVVDFMPRYSDQLLMCLMRSHCPEKYRDRYERRAGDSNGQPDLPVEALREAMKRAGLSE